MTHRTPTAVAAGLALWVAAAVVGQPTKPAAPPAAAPGSASPQVVGLAGCAARGCHGGPTTDDAGKPLPATVANACAVWLRHDRHSEGFRALLTDRSKKMVAHLGWGPAEQEARCLACHVTPALAAAPLTPDVARLRADGVGCDACHTTPGRSADEWLEVHKSGSPANLARCYSQLGMRSLASTKLRADACVGCHVGAPAADGVPAREVTHDLIAAGHPRLNFDYATFVALMPPHWAEKRPVPPVSEWFDGKVSAARAGLALAADQTTRTWPELAAFGCYSCHHEFLPAVGGVKWRQDRLERGEPLPWAGVPLPLREVLPPGTDADFAKLMEKVSLDRGKVRDAANGLSAKLATAAPPDAKTLLAKLDSAKSAKPLDWDDAAQTYYALAAVNRARTAADPARKPDGADKSLADARLRLRADPAKFRPGEVAPLLSAASAELRKWFAAR